MFDGSTPIKRQGDEKREPHRLVFKLSVLAMVAVLTAAVHPLSALDIEVVDPAGNPVSGYRWLVEQDATIHTTPGAAVSDSIGLNIHRSYNPVAASGHEAGSIASVALPSDQRYFVSVLPDTASSSNGHAMASAPVAPGQTSVRVVVHPTPIPTAQISVYVFRDDTSINNAPDLGVEAGLEGFTIIIADGAGQVITDAFGNMIGSTYLRNPDGSFILDADGQPTLETRGLGFVTSGADGWATIKFLAPNKYAVIVIPPTTDDLGNPVQWIQTSTIEGTNVIDAWVKADEPRLFVEGFGTATAHVSFGFLNPEELPWALSPPPAGGSTISGRLRYNHFARPPTLQGYVAGEPVADCWVGLNDPTSRDGLIAVPCDDDSSFSIPNVPAGTYQLVTWDEPLDALFGFNTVVVPPGGGAVDLGDVLSFRWFGTLQGYVFNDLDEDGFRDPNEKGISDQAVGLRFRDGRSYQVTVSDPSGFYSLSEVFPFFKWLVAEVDFLRFKATGATMAVDDGGTIPPDDGWIVPSRGKLNPQAQVDGDGLPIINPNTGNNLSRTETGPVLTEAMQLFLGQTNVIDWGKSEYLPGEGGGISGIVYYSVTRAENDPLLAAAEPWEPGVPRVQVALYADVDANGVIDDMDGDGGPTLADVDNHPFDNFPSPEDLDRNGNGAFDPGDALAITSTDSWDDNLPSGCMQPELVVHGQVVRDCFDNFGTWNQIRPGVFDGGYAFLSHVPGGIVSGAPEVEGIPAGDYIVEIVPPPGYELVKEEDRNVDFGEIYTPSDQAKDAPPDPQLIPPECVGDLHVVPAELSLFPGIPAPWAGESRPLCDRRAVRLGEGQNAGAEFFLFTPVPKAALIVGFVNNDLSAEFNSSTPHNGEKAAPSWLPISLQTFDGHEFSRVYTDEFGAYTALVPSTFTVNIPTPTGVSSSMITVCLNHPFMPDPANPAALIPDPFYDPDYSQSCWTLNFSPGAVTYLDTPIVPVGAFVGYPNRNLDVEPADLVPGIHSVDGPSGGPVTCADNEMITIQSRGLAQVPNPDYDPDNPASQPLVTRDYGFGDLRGVVWLNDQSLPIVSWSDLTVTAMVPPGAESGQLLVQRGDNLATSPTGLTLHVGECSAIRVPSDYPTIQAAIDAASPGDLILVAPGTYNENPIMWQPVRLQGSGAATTTIFANPSPLERLEAWHAKLESLIGAAYSDQYRAKEAPGIMVEGLAGVPFGGNPCLIDGFTITGALSGGGIFLDDGTAAVEISNTVLRANQGVYAGGISLGTPDIDAVNSEPYIHHNRIVKNGGVVGAGGIGISTGATDYRIEDNFISGNFSRANGGGIGQVGLATGGIIARNDILFNEVFYGGEIGGDGGGVYLSGRIIAGDIGPGAGSVTLEGNLIQGNLAGSGNGGGLCAFGFNGTDVRDGAGPQDWHRLLLIDNVFANNVAGHAGGGIFLQDVASGEIIHNTVANNDSTATSADAFPAGDLLRSTPRGAGIVGSAHSPQLAAAFPAGFEQTYSNPLIANSIVHGNRAFSWDASLAGGSGALVPDPSTPDHWDLQVVGLAGASLNPVGCLLTQTAGTDPSNISGDPQFELAYSNSLVAQPVVDEGGNQISVRYTPITKTSGDYHLASGSPAIDAATASYIATYPGLEDDIDGGTRFAGSEDLGADEYRLVGDVNCDGVLNGQDVNALIQRFFFGTSACGNDDVNGDGFVDIRDLSRLVEIL